MSELIVPPTLAVLLTAFTSCFQERSYLTFQWLVLGWVECQGRHTITTVALASGALGQRHISVFHRFFSRASWSLDALGHGLFGLALAWVPTDQPLVVLGDDTLARKGGKSIALASMHHDPLLSQRAQAVFQLRARVGRAGAVGAAAVRDWTRLRPAGAVPAVYRCQAGR